MRAIRPKFELAFLVRGFKPELHLDAGSSPQRKDPRLGSEASAAASVGRRSVQNNSHILYLVVSLRLGLAFGARKTNAQGRLA